MADAVATPTPTFQRAGGDGYRVTGTIAISASPATYATGGIVLSFFKLQLRLRESQGVSLSLEFQAMFIHT
jgi:hypothetical protein